MTVTLRLFLGLGDTPGGYHTSAPMICGPGTSFLWYKLTMPMGRKIVLSVMMRPVDGDDDNVCYDDDDVDDVDERL